jgi:hypothetical protein
MKRTFILSSLFLTFLLLASFALTAQASPSAQLPQYTTPTPGADGQIIYIVQEGDTCLRIQLLMGVPVAQLRALNKLDENCTLSAGIPLVIGIGGPAGQAPTAGPAPTATPGVPTPTPLPGFASVCILLYDDVNGDSLRQDIELTIADGAVSLSGASGQFSEARPTIAGSDPVCFENVPKGNYNISAAAPEGYYPTTQQTYTLEVLPGSEYYVDFGAQKSDNVIDLPGETVTENRSGVLGIVGGVLLLLGLGLGIYSWRVFGRKPPMQETPRPPGIVR